MKVGAVYKKKKKKEPSIASYDVINSSCMLFWNWQFQHCEALVLAKNVQA